MQTTSINSTSTCNGDAPIMGMGEYGCRHVCNTVVSVPLYYKSNTNCGWPINNIQIKLHQNVHRKANMLWDVIT